MSTLGLPRPARTHSTAWPIETRVFAVLAGLVLFGSGLGLAGLDAGAQLRIVAVPALLLGLPHGALDPAVARAAGVWEGRRGSILFHLAYLALAGATVAAFVLAPVVSLAVFLAASAWHFSGDQRHAAGPYARLATGTALVSLPAAARPEQVGELYALVTTPAATVIADVQAAAAPAVLAALGIALVAVWRRDVRAGVELVLTAALALVAPPLVFFAVYFAALHAPRHLREAVATVGRQGRTMALYAGLAAVGLAAAGLVLAPSVGVDSAIASIVFIGLAALTTPHMLLVERAQRDSVLRPDVP